MFARGGAYSTNPAVARPGSAFRAARPPIRRAAMAIAVLAALAVAAPVAADPAAIVAMTFASPAGTYAIGDEILVSAAFDKPVSVTGSPQLALNIGGTARRAGYRSGGGTKALVFAYAVAEGDADGDGIAIGADRSFAPADSIAGPGGAAVSPIHRALDPDPTRTVDGVRPTALFATVVGGQVAVNWDEALTIEDGLGIPGGFALFVGGAPAPVGAVGVSGRRVFLALDRTIGDGEWVTLSYTPPAARPLRDLAGNRAAGFSLTVTARQRGICQRTPVRERIAALLLDAARPGYSGG